MQPPGGPTGKQLQEPTFFQSKTIMYKSKTAVSLSWLLYISWLSDKRTKWIKHETSVELSTLKKTGYIMITSPSLFKTEPPSWKLIDAACFGGKKKSNVAQQSFR